jgi:serine/threonine protein kinase
MELLNAQMKRTCGTPKFFAPEVISASRDFKKYHYPAMTVDIYTLALTIQAMMTTGLN